MCAKSWNPQYNLLSSLNLQGIDWELYIQHCVHG